MKRVFALALIFALLLGACALAEEAEGVAPEIDAMIEDGGFIIRIPVGEGDLGWAADDMAQDDSVVALADEDVVDGVYVVRYDAVGDGDVTVGVRHFYNGFATDRYLNWDLHVADGAVREFNAGADAQSPDEAEMDPYLTGAWTELDTQFTQMSVEKNPFRGWDVEIASPLTHGAYIFKTTVYYDCEAHCFVYDKGKFWDVPVTEEEDAELGEAKIAGATGSFTFVGDDENLLLSWYSDVSPETEVIFERAAEDTADGYGESDIYTPADMDAAVARIEETFAGWEGCEMHGIAYAGDECASAENLEWLNGLGEGGNYAECIEFLSDFHSPVEGGGAWEADTEYTDWQWWLARAEGGEWELVSWGY